MDDRNHKVKNNIFLNRGCNSTPQGNGRDEQVFKHGCCKLDSSEWLNDVATPQSQFSFNLIEVRFKNSRKDFFRTSDGYNFNVGDIVAVEAAPGHDIGIVTLTGETARLQMKKKDVDPSSETIKKIYRRARASDIEKWVSAVEREDSTMQKTKAIANELGLEMKFNDIEYQGDNTKAIFYYTAEERVDFRELIKKLAEQFRIRIEMKQIGVRQEASRIGGIGSCGRELCCATWLVNFKSVTTNAARVQQLSLNPQKLAGQCSKLKCCLKFECDNYLDAMNSFPDPRIVLKTKKGEAIHHKTDIFSKIMWYSYADDKSNIHALPVDQVKEIIEENNKGKSPDKLEDFTNVKERKVDFENSLNHEDLKRFDEKK
ncbi:MAG: regulatory iron-sulfur-containing complex subunit RicT [Bacteroidota bacterium]|nr:regulatory iron-sulfur-containing complex subunit RicT [Bacteroidota bacterium]